MQVEVSQFPSSQHDHEDCIADAISVAKRLCEQRGLRFTALRQRVLELVWQSHKPVGAYDVLDRLGDEGRKAAPPTVYRALEFLMDAGLVHRLNSLNAYIGCADPAESHSGQFLICGSCHLVAELDDHEIESLVASKASERGFSVKHQMLEIEGLCDACRLAQ